MLIYSQIYTASSFGPKTKSLPNTVCSACTIPCTPAPCHSNLQGGIFAVLRPTAATAAHQKIARSLGQVPHYARPGTPPVCGAPFLGWSDVSFLARTAMTRSRGYAKGFHNVISVVLLDLGGPTGYFKGFRTGRVQGLF